MKKFLMTSLVLTLILSSCAGLADPFGIREPGAAEEPSPLPQDGENTLTPDEGVLPSLTPGGEETPIAETTPENGQSGKSQELPYRSIVELVVRDLALRLDLEAGQIEVSAVESRQWPDAGLGCPLPGMDYAQVITPGYRITLEAEGKAYRYHTDTARAFILCREGDPQLPVIPVDPDEIQDGEPWMPVDPLPTLIEGKNTADPEPIK
jgi:hypothetical protein